MRRQSWRLRVGSADAAFAVRTRFRAEVENLLPAFNRAFDAWAPEGTVLRIPRLELSLHIGSLGDLAGALLEALRRETPSPAASARAAAADRLEILQRYLETGALEWHAAQRGSAEAATQLRATLAAELERVAQRAPAEGAPVSRRLAYYLRLLQLLAEEHWRELVRHVARRPAVAPHAGPLDEALAALAARAAPGAHPARRLAAVALVAAGAPQGAAAALREELSVALGIDAAADSGSLLARLAELPAPAARFLVAHAGVAPSATTRAVADVGEPAVPSPPPAPRAPAAEADPPRGKAPPQVPERTASLSRGAKPAPSPPPIREPRAAEADPPHAEAPREAPQSFALVAGNAGLVLLHPFLPQLFKTCGWYRPPVLSSLPRAAALMHWLATGGDEPYEFELGAVKLLLGLRPRTQLAVAADLLGESERDEGAALLRAAIGHWRALKGTSIDGLRASFLQRRAALSEEDTGWRMRVESEAFDLLLGRLPWGIATVKLPWMTRPLYTDWPTP